MKKMVYLFLVIIFVMFLGCSLSWAKTAVTKSISSGYFEDGVFKKSDSSFEATYEIDESIGTIVLSQILVNQREGRFEEGKIYDITHTQLSEGLSALFVSRDKKGQKIITAAGEEDLGAYEVLILGEDFYEYCQAANGKFYLEYGDVVITE